MPNQRTIAKELGLTQATVSMALRNAHSIPEATRARVRKKAEEAEAAYDAALVAARAKAQEIAQATRDEIQKDVDAAIAKADAEIAARAAEGEKRIAAVQAEAMTAVAEVANDTAEAIVEAIAPGVADAKEIKSAVAGLIKS